jgi:hypothetical protein
MVENGNEDAMSTAKRSKTLMALFIQSPSQVMGSIDNHHTV